MAFWFGKAKERGQETEPVADVATTEEKRTISSFEEESLKNLENAVLETPFPAGTTVVGKVNFDKPVRIEGNLEGELFSASQVVVEKQGVLAGVLEADVFEVYGELKGEVFARKKLVAYRGAQIAAKVISPSFEVHEGAVFNGECVINKADR
ncbi:MAG: bactofilin family protein [Bdellovibrionota bacterium]